MMRADLFLKRRETMETMETAQLCRVLAELPREPGSARAARGGEGAPVPAHQGLPGRRDSLTPAAPERQNVCHGGRWYWKLKILEDDLHTWLFVVPPVPHCGPTDLSARQWGVEVLIILAPHELMVPTQSSGRSPEG